MGFGMLYVISEDKELVEEGTFTEPALRKGTIQLGPYIDWVGESCVEKADFLKGLDFWLNPNKVEPILVKGPTGLYYAEIEPEDVKKIFEGLEEYLNSTLAYVVRRMQEISIWEVEGLIDMFNESTVYWYALEYAEFMTPLGLYGFLRTRKDAPLYVTEMFEVHLR